MKCISKSEPKDLSLILEVPLMKEDETLNLLKYDTQLDFRLFETTAGMVKHVQNTQI